MPPPKKPKDGPTCLETFLSDEEGADPLEHKHIRHRHSRRTTRDKHSSNTTSVIMQHEGLPTLDNEDSITFVSISGWPSNASFSHLLDDSNNPDIPQDLTTQNGPRTPRTNPRNATPTDWLYPPSSRSDYISETNPPMFESGSATQTAHFKPITPDDSVSNKFIIKPIPDTLQSTQSYLTGEYMFKTIENLQDLISNDTGSPLRFLATTSKNNSPLFTDGGNLHSLFSSPFLQTIQDNTNFDGETMTNVLLPLLNSGVASVVVPSLAHPTNVNQPNLMTAIPQNIMKHKHRYVDEYLFDIFINLNIYYMIK